MHTEACRDLGYGGVPWGTSSKNRPKGNEGTRLKANDEEQFGFKMETEALQGLVYGGVPLGTSSKNRPKGNEGMRLKANCSSSSSLMRSAPMPH